MTQVHSMRSADEVLQSALRDPALRAEWERTAVARALAVALVRYRAEHGLTQRQLAERLGWKQPAVARLERGDHVPSLGTLTEVASGLGIGLALTAGPVGTSCRAVALRPPEDASWVVREDTPGDGLSVQFAYRESAAV